MEYSDKKTRECVSRWAAGRADRGDEMQQHNQREKRVSAKARDVRNKELEGGNSSYILSEGAMGKHDKDEMRLMV